jgi:hypothetical protein
MPSAVEYPIGVNSCSQRGRSQRSNLASTTLFAVLMFPAFLVSSAFAQFNNAASVGATHAFSVAPPTGAVSPPTGSVAPRTGPVAPPTSGFVPSNPGFHGTNFPHSPNGSHTGNGNHPHHGSDAVAVYPYFYGVAVPYAADLDATDAPPETDQNDDAEYQGGPTVFDRRGSGPDSYVPESYAGPWRPQERENGMIAQSADPADHPGNDPPQVPTALVFKDGHQLDVENYAIVGPTLYDLTPGHARKIDLASLDLPATEKQNDDRGVVFELPPSPLGSQP